MYREYPYSTYYNDIDEICRMCRDLGLRLEVKNDYLRLIDKKGNVLSNVKISWADAARYDDQGHFITSYVMQIGADAHKLVITHGDNSVSTVTVPYAEEAELALRNILTLEGHEDGLFYKLGNGDNGLIIPGLAIRAQNSDKGRDIDEFATELVNDGDYIGLKDNYNTFLSRIIPALATKAQKDIDGDDIKSTYANDIQNGVNTVKLLAKDGTLLKELLIGYAEKAKYDQDGNEIDTFYGHSLDTSNGQLSLKDAHGSVLSQVSINGISQVQVIGDQLVFTDGAGQSISITIPYAIKAQKDAIGNTISSTYIASVQNDPNTGALNFLDATGAIVCTLTPTVTQASQDNYGNNIADYIKTLVADNQSDYILATHGDGTVDSITINYSNVAWKDTNGNVIKNSYTKRVAYVEDPSDHKLYLVGYNGDTPEAEIWRANPEVDLSNLPYGKSLDLTNNTLSLIDGAGNVLDSVELSINEQPIILKNNRLKLYLAGWYTSDPSLDPQGTQREDVTDVTNKTFSQGNYYWLEFGNYNGTNLPEVVELTGKSYHTSSYTSGMGTKYTNSLGDGISEYVVEPSYNMLLNTNNYSTQQLIDIAKLEVANQQNIDWTKLNPLEIYYMPYKHTADPDDQLVDDILFTIIVKIHPTESQAFTNISQFDLQLQTIAENSSIFKVNKRAKYT